MAGLSLPREVLSVKCVIFGSVGPQTARFDLSGVPSGWRLFLFARRVPAL